MMPMDYGVVDEKSDDGSDSEYRPSAAQFSFGHSNNAQPTFMFRRTHARTDMSNAPPPQWQPVDDYHQQPHDEFNVPPPNEEFVNQPNEYIQTDQQHMANEFIPQQPPNELIPQAPHSEYTVSVGK